MPLSPFNIYNQFVAEASQAAQVRQLKRTIKENANFNYAANESIREMVSTSEYTQSKT
ncbi:hypothetical protein [Microseira sp. BLCC-F43]|uniref:hypothetical protein n=1 Tax=Microseira sp. BLCC-F43 TaxID=3153602 RepID=UPI0035BB9DB5